MHQGDSEYASMWGYHYAISEQIYIDAGADSYFLSSRLVYQNLSISLHNNTNLLGHAIFLPTTSLMREYNKYADQLTGLEMQVLQVFLKFCSMCWWDGVTEDE